MNYKQIEDRIRSLKKDRAKRDMIKLELEGLTDYIDNINNIPDDSDTEAIEAMTLKVPGGEMVSSSGNSDKTGKIALNYQDYGKVDLSELVERKRGLKQKFKSADNKVRRTEIALDSLTEKERYVVEKTVMERYSYKDVEVKFNKEMSREGAYITDRGIKHMKFDAIKKMLEVVSA